MPYIPLQSRPEMVAATEGEPGVYSLIYAYDDTTDDRAEQAASASSKDPLKAYSVDVTKYPKAKEFLTLHQIPTVVVYRDGKEVKRVEGMSQEKADELGEYFF